MPFQKGVSGNPGGRPKKDWTWGQLLEEVANEIEPKSGRPFKELVSRRLWIDAVNGNIAAQKEIMNRMEGLPIAKTEISGKDGEKLEIEIIEAKKENKDE